MNITAFDLAQRFWTKVDKGGDCWIWTASKKPAGYGQFHCFDQYGKRKTLYAHRVAWESMVGPIPGDMSVLHKCDNRACVRPDHMFLGTDADNALDKARKGRAGKKLDSSCITAIRAYLAAGLSTREVAHAFAVSQSQVWLIGKGRIWRWVA